MSGTLSQEEIDRMMREASGETMDESEIQFNKERPVLTDFEKDGLGEIGNISMGTASTTLNILLNQEVSITTPEVEVVNWEEVIDACGDECLIIEVNYTKGFQGSSVLLIKEMDAKIIADLMMGGDGNNTDEPLNDFHISAISEAMNQMIGTSATSMSSIFDVLVDIAPPNVIAKETEKYDYTNHLQVTQGEAFFVKTSFRLVVGELIDSRIMQLLSLPFALDMFNTLIGKTGIQTESNATDKLSQQQDTEIIREPEINQSNEKMENDSVKARGQDTQTGDRNIDLLLNVPMNVTVELGRTNKLIKDVLSLGPGSVIELDTFSGEKVDILVNGKRIAQGEVVVVDDAYGVKVTDIIKQRNRL